MRAHTMAASADAGRKRGSTSRVCLCIERVVLAGLTSHTCVEGTGRHALEAGFHVPFLSDGMADFTEAALRAAIDLSYPTFGHPTLTIDAFLDMARRDA